MLDREHLDCLCRGKFDVVFTTTHLALRNAKNILQVRYTDIKAVYILDKLPAERAGKVYLVLQFNSSCTVTHGKRALDNFTLELSDKQTLDIVVDPKASPNQKAERKKVCYIFSLERYECQGRSCQYLVLVQCCGKYRAHGACCRARQQLFCVRYWGR